MRPTWAEISLPALRKNYSAIRQHVAPNATVCAVVKADAYGHGSVACARALEADGASWFGVSSVDEALVLRRGGVRSRILLLSGFWRGDAEAIIQNDLTPSVWEPWQIEHLQEAAARIDGAFVRVHMKVNTGMNRLGIDFAELQDFLHSLKGADRIAVEGMFTHLASAEVLDAPSVGCQLSQFEQAVLLARSQGLSPTYLHVANSAAVILHGASWNNMVRPGLLLYGYHLPFTTLMNGAPDVPVDMVLHPVLSWKTRVLTLRQVGAGQPLGYGGAYVTQSPALIAALPVGYADGLSRRLSSRGRVIIRDHHAPIVGNVSMDLTLVDVTGVPGVSIGDEAILIGSSEHCSIDAWEHANHCGTIAYEILCNISKRVQRTYVDK